jgi:cyclopropane fatty-acyl-phospholipid synthase-like methyltransferase
LQKLVRFAEERYLQRKITVANCDARDWEYPSDAYDLVTSATGLDHIPESDLKPLLERIFRSLRKKGIIFLEVHTVDGPGYTGIGKKSDLPFAIQHYFRPNELLKLLEPDCCIIRYEEKMELDPDHGEPHFPGFANVLARKDHKMEIIFGDFRNHLFSELQNIRR